MRNKLIEKAKAMRAEGKSLNEIGRVIGRNESTIRVWLDPVKYAAHKAKAIRWQAEHKDRVNELQRKRNREITDEGRARRAAYARRQYATKPEVRERLRMHAAKRRRTGQGYIEGKVRQITLGHADRMAPTFTGLMEAATGMSRDQFSALMAGEGNIDHIVPIVAFHLIDPTHLLRCLHPSNVRVISREENQRKGDSGREVDIEALPWINTPDSMARAEIFILRCLNRCGRLKPV